MMPAMARLLLIGLMLLVALPARGAYIVEPTMQPIVRPLMAVPTGAPAGTAPAGASLEQQFGHGRAAVHAGQPERGGAKLIGGSGGRASLHERRRHR